MDLDRLRYLAAEGDTQAAAELARQEQRHGSVIPPLLNRLRDAHERSDDDKARALVFALHCAGYDQLRWWMMGVEGVYYRTETVPLITGKHGAPDHFKGLGRHRNATERAVVFPGPHGLLFLPLIWDQAALDKARVEMATYARHYGRRLVNSPQWAAFVEAHPTNAWLGPVTHIIRSGWPEQFGRMPDLAPLQSYIPGCGSLSPTRPVSPGAVAGVVLQCLDPDATLDHLRATVTAARVYTRRLLDGITEGEGVATRRALARMLAAIYCGQDHTITPKD